MIRENILEFFHAVSMQFLILPYKISTEVLELSYVLDEFCLAQCDVSALVLPTEVFLTASVSCFICCVVYLSFLIFILDCEHKACWFFLKAVMKK